MSRISSLLLAVCLMITATHAAANGPTPPRAEQRPFTVTSPFGNREDPWYWLRDDKREDKDMLAYLEAENAYTATIMAPQRAAQEKLYNEIIGRLKLAGLALPEGI